MVDPLGLWTFQIGLGFNFGFGLGGTTSWGIAISSDPCTGEKEFGLYTTRGLGFVFGGILEGALDVTASQNNKISDLDGLALTVGGSGGTPIAHVGAGCELNIPIGGGNEISPSATGSITGGLSAWGGETHAFITSTKTVTLRSWK